MSVDPDRLMGLLEQARRPLGVKELLRISGLNPGEQTELKRALRELLRRGLLEKEGKRFLVPGRTGEAKSGTAFPKEGKSSRADRTAVQVGPGAGKRSRALEPQAQPGRKKQRDEVSKSRGPERSASGIPPASRLRRDARNERDVRTERPARGERSSSRGRGTRPERETGAQRAQANTLEGVLHVHRDGFGFVHPLTGDHPNVFLPPHEARRAMDNDVVRVEVSSSRPGRFEGRLVDVRARRRRQVVGVYHARGQRSFVTPTDQSLQEDIRVPSTQIARDGDVVKVTLGVGADVLEEGEGLFGEVAGSLGRPGDPSQEVLSIAFSQGFSDEFPPEVMEEADQFGQSTVDADASDRKDLRSMPLVTIDGQDARDFDDAIFVERLSTGYRLVVAIADVSHYVTPKSALDAEALHRATSVYLPDRVLPMLPERLSNGLCSLRPNEDRLCMVSDIRIDKSGKRTGLDVYAAVMRSAARCTYEEVQDVLDGKDVPHRNAFREHFEVSMALASVLRGMREKRGAIDFDIPETRVVLNHDGQPVRMERRSRKDSHRLVEECMLAANEAVASYFQERGLPSVYRFHGEPDEDKLAVFAGLASTFGFHLPKTGEPTSKDLNLLLEKMEGHAEQRALNQLLLRSMMQAVYTSQQVGHYGLAAEMYLHFTSPIRRYPDLLVHRLLKAYWASGKKPLSDAKKDAEEERLEALAVQSSERERGAMQVEREVVAFYATLLMKDRVGEEFDATVSSITDFGFFVELKEELVEGLVKGERLGPDFELDSRTHSLNYSTGRSVRVGQALTVRLIGSSTERRQLDFDVVAFEGESRRRAPASPPARRQASLPPRRRDAPPREVEEPLLESSPRESPHPGFDRLRALAARKGAQPSSQSHGAPRNEHPDRYGRRPKRRRRS